MGSLKNLIDEMGKFDFQSLKAFAKGHDQETFLATMPERVLVGAGLFRGWFLSAEDPSGADSIAGTVMFQPEDRQQKATRLKILEHNIYPLVAMKKMDGESKKRKVVTLTVGRSKKCDIILADPSISSEHAEFRVEAGDGTLETACFVRDLGSSNGVFVNGSRLAAFWTKDLAVGDEIRLSRFSVILSNSVHLYPKLRYG